MQGGVLALLAGGRATPAADVYAFGVTLWEIATRKVGAGETRRLPLLVWGDVVWGDGVCACGVTLWEIATRTVGALVDGGMACGL